MTAPNPRGAIAHALEPRLRCACGTCTSIAAEAVVTALQGHLFTANDARLLRLAIDWIGGAMSDDPSGEPWLMTRTMQNQLIERFDQYAALVGTETPWTVGGSGHNNGDQP